VIHFELLKGILEQELWYGFLYIMTRLLVILILLCSFKVFSKEYVNRDFNIKLTLPDDYTILDSVSIEEVSENVESRVSTESLEKLKQTISNNQKISVLYLVDEISLVTRNDNIMDNISIGSMNYSLEKLNDNQMQEWCSKRLIDLGKSANREISKFECYISDRIKDAILTKYHQHENQYPNSFQAQYTNWFKPHKVIVITLTCHIETCENHLETFHNIVSTIEYYGSFDGLYEKISNPNISNEEILFLIKELNIVLKKFAEFSAPCNSDLNEHGVNGWNMLNCNNYFNDVYLSLNDEEENKKLFAVSDYFESLKNEHSFSKKEQKMYNELLLNNNETWEKLIEPLNIYDSLRN